MNSKLQMSYCGFLKVGILFCYTYEMLIFLSSIVIMKLNTVSYELNINQLGLKSGITLESYIKKTIYNVATFLP